MFSGLRPKGDGELRACRFCPETTGHGGKRGGRGTPTNLGCRHDDPVARAGARPGLPAVSLRRRGSRRAPGDSGDPGVRDPRRRLPRRGVPGVLARFRVIRLGLHGAHLGVVVRPERRSARNAHFDRPGPFGCLVRAHAKTTDTLVALHRADQRRPQERSHPPPSSTSRFRCRSTRKLLSKTS